LETEFIAHVTRCPNRKAGRTAANTHTSFRSAVVTALRAVGVNVDEGEPRDFKTYTCTTCRERGIDAAEITAHCSSRGCPAFAKADAASSGPDISFTLSGVRYLIDVTLAGAACASNRKKELSSVFQDVVADKIAKYKAKSDRAGRVLHIVPASSNGVLAPETEAFINDIAGDSGSRRFGLRYHFSRGALCASADTLLAFETDVMKVGVSKSPGDTIRDIIARYHKTRLVFRIRQVGTAHRRTVTPPTVADKLGRSVLALASPLTGAATAVTARAAAALSPGASGALVALTDRAIPMFRNLWTNTTDVLPLAANCISLTRATRHLNSLMEAS
jgi:hypothetical protein